MNRKEISPYGKIIKKRLIDKDMTHVKLANQLGISPQYLNLIIHGERTGKKYKEKINSLLEIEG